MLLWAIVQKDERQNKERGTGGVLRLRAEEDKRKWETLTEWKGKALKGKTKKKKCCFTFRADNLTSVLPFLFGRKQSRHCKSSFNFWLRAERGLGRGEWGGGGRQGGVWKPPEGLAFLFLLSVAATFFSLLCNCPLLVATLPFLKPFFISLFASPPSNSHSFLLLSSLCAPTPSPHLPQSFW